MTEFAMQLYSARALPKIADTLATLAELGYASVEGYDALYPDPGAAKALAGALERAGLSMPTAHVSLDRIEMAPAHVVETARILGIDTVYCPYLPPERRPQTLEGWTALGRRVAHAGQPLRDAGLRLGWHNHDFELMPAVDGALPLAAILDGGGGLDWEVDIGWIVRAGADPAALLAEHGARVSAVHLKDVAPDASTDGPEDGWADVGHGVVDWRAVAPAILAAGGPRLVIEHDRPADFLRFASRSIAAARAIFASGSQ